MVSAICAGSEVWLLDPAANVLATGVLEITQLLDEGGLTGTNPRLVQRIGVIKHSHRALQPLSFRPALLPRPICPLSVNDYKPRAQRRLPGGYKAAGSFLTSLMVGLFFSYPIYQTYIENYGVELTRFTKQNISEWTKHGFCEWQMRQAALKFARTGTRTTPRSRCR